MALFIYLATAFTMLLRHLEWLCSGDSCLTFLSSRDRKPRLAALCCNRSELTSEGLRSGPSIDLQGSEPIKAIHEINRA